MEIPYISLYDFAAINDSKRTRVRHFDPNFWQCLTELKCQKHTVNAIHYFRSGNVTEARTYLKKIDFRVSVVRIPNGNTQFRPVRRSWVVDRGSEITIN